MTQQFKSDKLGEGHKIEEDSRDMIEEDETHRN
jgi:hypothetical protein